MRAWAKLAGLALAVVFAAEFLFRSSRPATPAGGAAPALAMADLSGRKVDLSRLKGRVVAVNFWASWCAPCQLEIPDLAEVWRRNRDRCFEVLGVAEESGGDADVRTAASKLGIPYPVLNDSDGAVAARFKVPGYPRTYLIDAEGRIRQIFDGALDRLELERTLAPLLPGKPGICGSHI